MTNDEDDETVWMARPGTSVYHTNKDCTQLSQTTDPREYPREIAEAWYRLCEACNSKGSNDRGGDRGRPALRDLVNDDETNIDL